jgi:RNA polymerase sigma-70 factor (ECF subfamily)
MNSEPHSPVKELLAAHDAFVRGLALRLAPAPGLAEDVAQQVFLEFLAKEAEWDLSRDIKPLLAAMTRNVARRCWRERMHTLPEVQRELAEHICQLAESREVAWAGEEEKTILRRCLDRLPAKSRRLIELHYYLETSSVEIAQQTDMRPDAVRRALFRLREQLRRCINKFLPAKSL